MRVLWITNTIFPAACKELGISLPFVGGWMYSGMEHLVKTYKNIEIGVASLYSGRSLKTIHSGGVTYFLLPRSTSKYLYDQKLEAHWSEVQMLFKPDLVHIHGSEYPYGLAYVNACGRENVVVSVQGLVSVIERYYLGGIEEKDLNRNKTLRDWVKHDSVLQQRLRMQKQGEYEKLLIGKIHHVIGRTSWDKAHVRALNSGAYYHFCNETLRNEFYKHKWQQNTCKKHQILLSQSYYPLKGLHQVIKALPLILKYYPDTKVVVTGDDFIQNKKAWRMKGYAKYIRTLMKNSGVEGKIIFTGVLPEKEMCEKYLESNVFVCPSSIENSSNSIGEAQLLGVPCVASFVGGTADMITHEETGLLYRFEEVEMLAEAVFRIFSDADLARLLSENGIIAARQRHDRQQNVENLYTIYQEVCRK
jgi:glycosyltransferase involved in cell wall biosynthesis